jgi:hypothetical protein
MRHNHFVSIGCFALLSLCAHVASAVDVGPYEITVQLDMRWVDIESPYTSFTNGGLGQLRFDEAHDGLRLGRAMVDFTGPLTETIRANLTLNATGDHDAYPIDATEAFLEWRPYPQNNLRWRTRVGAFYAPISLENRSVGWQSPYSISTSAINSWIGEETRTIGIEQSLTLINLDSHRDYEVGLVAGLYGWNDPMGILIFQRGWALHDRQTGLFGGLPRPFSYSEYDQRIEFFREYDHRVGYYAGGEYKYRDQLVAQVLHYDNRGDTAVTAGKESTWLSRFDAIGLRYELPTHTTFITQALRGDTGVGPSDDGRGMLILDYWSYFALLSQQFEKHRVTARYDRLYSESTRGAYIFDSKQTAIAWTFAYMWDIDRHWQLAAEALQIQGALMQRSLLGLPQQATERSWQLAVRFSL